MSTSSAASDWSDDLKAQTRDIIDGLAFFVAHDGQLYLKHITSRFGTIAEDDLQRGVLKLVERGTKAEATFANADELIAAGWVID